MTQASDVAGVIRRFYEAIAAGDIDAVERLSSDDDGAVAIGTDPEEWWEGGRTIKAALREYVAEAQHRIKPGRPRIGRSGDVAWFADRPALVMAGGQEVPCRLTGVLRHEDGEWRIVQSHTSIGVPNAEAFGF
ncbi:MAG TPA: nuclear transport factor 2 family protein [Solirubrobacteraceae bacterium]|nr:nuclear transport factor 2 family protein [Solirubrobacteraceae bacterium]